MQPQDRPSIYVQIPGVSRPGAVADADGEELGFKGIPPEVFPGIAKYQPLLEPLSKAEFEEIDPTYEVLSSLGPASMMEWSGPLTGIGDLPSGKATVGQTWRESEDGWGKELLTIDDVQGDRVAVRRTDK